MTSENEPAPAGGNAVLWALTAVSVLCLVQVWLGFQHRAELRETRAAQAMLEETAARLEKSALEVQNVGERLDAIDERLSRIQLVADEWEFLVDDVQKLRRSQDDLIASLEGKTGIDVDAVAQPPDLDWTQPALREAARRAADSVGIELTEDEVRVPARIVLRQGIIEYFAVLKGGKEHETLLTLVGNTPEDQKRPPEFGVKLNNALQALGFQRGRPIRFTPAGTRPAEGETVYLFVEWEEDGKPVVVRAEDLVWNRVEDRSMQPGMWVYVGSSFVEGFEPDEVVFAADVTAEAVATYSAVNTIVDNRAEGAQDDSVFLVATPRVPEGVEYVTLVFRREDREPSRTFEVPNRESLGGGDEGE